MTQKWNLQDIRPAEPRKRRVPPTQGEATRSYQEQSQSITSVQQKEHIPTIVIGDGNKKAKNKLLISVIIFVFIIGATLILSATLGKTVITIYPEHRNPTINAEFVAYPDKRDQSLSYEIMTLEATGERQVKATGQIQVEEQATGVIEIIKTTAGAERLIKNTRFRSPNGLIFRIQESIVVPGAVKDGSGVSIPGTIQAKVFADDVGEAYNLQANTKFDVPGFSESGFTALYDAISARNPEAFTGGFKGPQFEIDESELSAARQALQIELRNTLLSRIDSDRPADYIAFPDSVAISYTALPSVQYGNDLVTIKEQAILQIPLFQMTQFGSFLASETEATYDGGSVRVDDPSALTFAYTNATTSESIIANETSLSFVLSGKPLLIWEYDAVDLAENLAGLPKTAIVNAVPAYPGIREAQAQITPFWKRSFPEDPSEIQIVEELKGE